jgi:hypothetical protein
MKRSTGCLKHSPHHQLRTNDVCLEKRQGIVQWARHMGFSCKMHHEIGLGNQLLNHTGVSDIAMVETEVRVSPQCLRQIVQASGICQSVQNDHMISLVVFQEMFDKVAADKASAPSDQELPHRLPFVSKPAVEIYTGIAIAASESHGDSSCRLILDGYDRFNQLYLVREPL